MGRAVALHWLLEISGTLGPQGIDRLSEKGEGEGGAKVMLEIQKDAKEAGCGLVLKRREAELLELRNREGQAFVEGSPS